MRFSGQEKLTATTRPSINHIQMEYAIPEFQKIALDLQQEMQAAIAEAEKLGAEALANREAAADARSKKTAVIRRCESRARETVQEFFHKNRAELAAEISAGMLNVAAEKLRNAGKSAEEIANILGVQG